MHTWTNPTLTCASCHVYRGDKCDAPCTSNTSSFHSSVAGTWEFRTFVHNNISVVQLKPTKKYICSACLSYWHLPRRSPPFIAEATSSSVGSPAHPQMLAAMANRWADTELKAPSSSDMVKANDDGLAFGSCMRKLKMKSFGGKPRRAPQRGARSRWGIHIQTKSTFFCGINGVGGGGGGREDRRERGGQGGGIRLWGRFVEERRVEGRGIKPKVDAFINLPWRPRRVWRCRPWPLFLCKLSRKTPRRAW